MNDEELIKNIKKEICPVKKPMSKEKDIAYFDYDNDLGRPNPKYNDPIKQREL